MQDVWKEIALSAIALLQLLALFLLGFILKKITSVEDKVSKHTTKIAVSETRIHVLEQHCGLE